MDPALSVQCEPDRGTTFTAHLASDCVVDANPAATQR